MEDKGWYERKVCRCLHKLTEEGILDKARRDGRSCYRPSPKKLQLLLALDVIAHLKDIVDHVEDIDNAAFYPQTSFLLAKMNEKRRSWLLLHPSPFWEYANSLSVVGFPKEDDLPPLEQALYHYMTEKISVAFLELAWLRVAVLARQVLGIQLEMTDFIKTMLFDHLSKSRPLSTEDLKKIDQAGRKEVYKMLRRIMTAENYPDVAIPAPTPNITIWKVLADLRKKELTCDFAVVASSGPKRAIRQGDYMLFGASKEDEGEPVPSLELAEKADNRPVILPYDESIPSIRAHSPYPFPITPRLLMSGYKYRIEEVTDQETLSKLKTGKLPYVALP